jgi:GDP-D-mannose dehydratase
MQIHRYTRKEVCVTDIDITSLFSFGIAMKLHYGDLNDSSSLVKIIASVKPTEIYNLGAMSHVKVNVFFCFFKNENI